MPSNNKKRLELAVLVNTATPPERDRSYMDIIETAIMQINSGFLDTSIVSSAFDLSAERRILKDLPHEAVYEACDDVG